MNKYGDKVLGIALVTSALLFLGAELGILPDFSFGTIVPGIIFTGLGIAGIYQRSFSQATFSFAFAYLFVYDGLGLPKVSFIALMLVAALLSVGFSLLFPPKVKKTKIVDGKKVVFDEQSNDISVIFGGVEKYISSDNLEEINISVTCGEAKVYFEHASMLRNEAVINLHSTFGETCIFVPRNWKVETSIKAIFGDVSKTGVIEDQVNTLYVKGNITCSEVQIIYI